MPDVAPLPQPTSGERVERQIDGARVACYRAGPDGTGGHDATTPLLLVHSVNAAASAFEVRPLFEHYRATRPVYALDLPGFGHSSRDDIVYTPRLMTDAIHAVVDAIEMRHGGAPIDVVGVSLGCEFVARAAVEHPEAFRTLALVSATGLDHRSPHEGPTESTRGRPALLNWLGRKPWSDAVFRLLTRRATIRWFLEKTYGSKYIDEDLLEYDVLTTRQPGASHAPFYFVSGFLFSGDITTVYRTIEAPVWLPHGTRGDFTDYRGAAALVAERGWCEQPMDTGALPHFERPAAFVETYDAWVRSAAVAGCQAP